MDNEIDVSSTNVPVSMELPPFQIDTVVVKPVVDGDNFFVCLGLPSKEKLGYDRLYLFFFMFLSVWCPLSLTTTFRLFLYPVAVLAQCGRQVPC